MASEITIGGGAERLLAVFLMLATTCERSLFASVALGAWTSSQTSGVFFFNLVVVFNALSPLRKASARRGKLGIEFGAFKAWTLCLQIRFNQIWRWLRNPCQENVFELPMCSTAVIHWTQLPKCSNHLCDILIGCVMTQLAIHINTCGRYKHMTTMRSRWIHRWCV